MLLAQETDHSTFRKQSERFLKNWICAGNTANYTARGRAYNPWTGEPSSSSTSRALWASQPASPARTGQCYRQLNRL